MHQMQRDRMDQHGKQHFSEVLVHNRPNMIPEKFRKQIDQDERYRYCFITGAKERSGLPIQIHHAIMGSGRPDEMWNYIPLRYDLHENGEQAVHGGNKMKWGSKTMNTREVCELAALLQAPNDDLIKYHLVEKFRYLLSQPELVECVETLTERWNENTDPLI